MAPAEERRLFRPQRQDAAQEPGVVLGRLRAHRHRRPPQLRPQGVVVQIREERLLRGPVQGEAPGRALRRAQVLRRRGLAGRLLAWAGRPARRPSSSTTSCCGIGRIEDVLGEFLGDLGELALQRLQTGPRLRREICTGLPEVGGRFLQKTPVDTLQRARRRRARKGLQPPPQLGIERNSGVEGRDPRQHRVVRGAQRRRIRHRLEVGDLGPAGVELLRRPFEGEKSILVRQGPEISARDSIDRRLRAAERRLHVRFNVLRGSAPTSGFQTTDWRRDAACGKTVNLVPSRRI